MFARLHIAVQQTLLVGVIQRLGDRGDDAHHVVGGHPVGWHSASSAPASVPST